MYNPSIPALSYIDIPNYKTIKANAQLIPKASEYDDSMVKDGLQYDQTIGHANLMKEREAAITIADYNRMNGNFVTNVPHQSELRNRILNNRNIKFSTPDIIYEAIIADARTLPKILFLEQLVSSHFARILLNNLVNIYTNSAAFYSKVITASDINFKLYERFIYLLTLIQIVLDNKNQSDFMEKDERLIDMVEWCLTRKIPDINYLLQGPTSNQEYSIDYQTMYYSLISPSSSKSSITDYLTLSTLQEVNANLLKYRDEFINNPNVYDKNPNYAQSYTISIDTRQNAKFKYDNVGNLVVDCNDVDLGSSTNDNIDLDMKNTIVNTETLKFEPKSQPTKFANLLHQFSIFRIKSLLILKTTYKTALRNYDTCYITFPNITLDGRFNQVWANGALQVPGKFKENNNNKYWEFEPFNDVVYIPKTANVKRFEFYVSPKPGSSNKPNPNNFKIATEINKYYNIPIRVHSIEELNNTPLAPSAELLPETYIIRSYKINNKGNPSSLQYTFLYNRTMKTIQLLPGQMDISNVPKFGVKKRMKSQQIHVGMMKPIYPIARIAIYEAMEKAIMEDSTKFRLPRVVPLTDLQTLEYMMAQATIKCDKIIRFKTDIRAYKLQIPDIILDKNFISQPNSSNSKTTALNNWLIYIIQTVGYDINIGNINDLNNENSDNLDKYNKLRDEIINKINDALTNNRDYIYIVEDKAVEEFDMSEYGLDPYKMLPIINTKEYDFSEVLNVKLSLIDQLFTIDYINSKILDAVDNYYPTVYINGEHYKYFELYLENGESFEFEELPVADHRTLFSNIKSLNESFTSSLNDLVIYIKYIPAKDIKKQIKKVNEEYIEDLIIHNTNSGYIEPIITILNNEYKTYNLSIKTYMNDEFVMKNKKRIENKEKYFDEVLNVNPKIVERYYIEYYGDEIKNKILKDINNTKNGIININGKDYQYVYFNDENKDLVFGALQNNQLYYYINSDSNTSNINNQTKVTITLHSYEILIDSARIYYFEPINDPLIKIPINEYGNGSFDVSGTTYYYKLNTSQITQDVNDSITQTVNYTDDKIIEECILGIKNNQTPIFNGVEWIKLTMGELSRANEITYQGYHGIDAVLHDMADNPAIDNYQTFYDSLITNKTYRMTEMTQSPIVNLIILSPTKIKYEMSDNSDALYKYAIELEGQLSDEYERAKLTYENYISSDKTNIINTEIPLPDILPTDSKDDIYRKWSNYYSYYGLFIPDFNYILDYQYVIPSTAQIYDGKNIVDTEYTLYDWMIPLYDVSEDGIILRTTKKVNAVLIENIVQNQETGKDEKLDIPVYSSNNELIPNIKSLLIDNYTFIPRYDLKNYKIDNTNSKIYIYPQLLLNTSEELQTLEDDKMELKIIQRENSNNEVYYEFILLPKNDSSNPISYYTKNITLPKNTTFNYIDETTPIGDTHKTLTLGLDPSIKYQSITINNKSIDDIENPDKLTNISDETLINNMNDFISSLYIINVDGVYTGEEHIQSDKYPDGIPIDELKLSSENFQEYDVKTNNNSDIITINYRIETVERVLDSTMTYYSDISIEYPNNLASLNDMNGEFTNYICYRNFDVTKNRYKTFIIDDDLLATNIDKTSGKPKKYSFTSDNWLFSIKKLMFSTSKTSPYVEVHDLKLSMLTNSTRQADYAQYMQPVLIKYFIQWINSYDIHLIINKNDYGFSDVSAFIDGSEYKLQVITDNLFSLDYKEIIDNTLEIYSSGSRFKMLIQLM